MRWFSLGLTALLFLTACSSVRVFPQPVADESFLLDVDLVRQTDELRVRMRLRDISVRPAPVESNICSFWVELENRSELMLPVSPKDFVLIAGDGQLFQSIEPEILLAQTKISAPYLIPYPYIGYYYLQDAYRAEARDQFVSQQAYFGSRRGEHIVLDGLTAQDVFPETRIAAAIYFPAELRTMKSFKIRYQVQGLPGEQSFPLDFAFSVEKN